MVDPLRNLLIAGLSIYFVSCTPIEAPVDLPVSQDRDGADELVATLSLPTDRSELAVAYTYHRPDGNRVVSGRGNVPNIVPVDIPLSSTPQWLAAAPTNGGSFWMVVGNDGTVETFLIRGERVTEIESQANQLPTGMPPAFVSRDSNELLVAPSAEASQATHPILLPGSGRIAYIERRGDIVIWDDRTGFQVRLPVNALPDARLLVDENDRILLLTDPTSEYAHGVLGDQVEAGGMVMVETQPEPQVVMNMWLPKGTVVEGIAPIWTDITGDDVREIIVTLSSEQHGAWIAIFNEEGKQIAAGPDIGQSYRWRHQIAVAPFGADDQPLLVDVLTPHLGGVVEFYGLVGDQLVILGRQPGYTSHVIGSRNLDMALAGDFNGDAHIELLLPNQGRTELAGIQYQNDRAGLTWSVPVGGKIMTNLAAVTLDNGSIALGVGHQGKVLRIWHP